MTAKEVTSILRTCSQSGVSELKIGNLCVRFFQPTPATADDQGEKQDTAKPAATDSAPTDVGHKPPEVPEDLEAFAREQALIDDPVAHEADEIDRLGDSAELDGSGLRQ